jgi:HEAT repeat protein
VRLANLSVLQERFPSTPEAREASLAGLEDTTPWMRLSAARFLPDEGREVLEALVRDRHVPDAAAAEAIALLAARLPPDRAGPLLVEILKSRTDDARRQAIEALGHLRYAPALGPLVVLLERADPATASAAAAALASLGDAKSETALLEVLTGTERDVRLAAVRALGKVGTVRAVEPLMRLAESGHADAETRDGVRDAIRAIHSRLHGAEAGQLSLAKSDGQSGWLSVPQPGAGEGDLSLASDGEETER